MNDQPEIEDFGKLEGKMKCEVTNFAIPNKNSSYEVPFYRSVTPHRRKRCGAFEKEGLICTDGKGFGSCKGKTSIYFYKHFFIKDHHFTLCTMDLHVTLS